MFDDIIIDKIYHVGFCLGVYEEEKCSDCLSLKKCLELYYKEKENYKWQHVTNK